MREGPHGVCDRPVQTWRRICRRGTDLPEMQILQGDIFRPRSDGRDSKTTPAGQSSLKNKRKSILKSPPRTHPASAEAVGRVVALPAPSLTSEATAPALRPGIGLRPYVRDRQS